MDEVEEDAVDSTPDPTVNSGLASLSSSSGSDGSAVPDLSTRGSAVPGSDPPDSPGAVAPLDLPGRRQQHVFLSSRSLHQQVQLKISPHCP